MPSDHPHSTETPAEIRDGIEWWPSGYGDGVMCARCGGDAGWLSCANCGGERYSHHECGEDCCCCVNPEDNVLCDWCDGAGGSWHCRNTPEWCEANPLSGREHIQSTAMRSEAWND